MAIVRRRAYLLTWNSVHGAVDANAYADGVGMTKHGERWITPWIVRSTVDRFPPGSRVYLFPSRQPTRNHCERVSDQWFRFIAGAGVPPTVEVEFDAAVAIDDRLDRTALMTADADAPWALARGSGIELAKRNERMLERRWLRRLTDLGRQPVPYDNDIVGGGAPQNGDRARARLWNFDGRHNDLAAGIYPPDVVQPHELQVGTLIIQNADSAWGSYERHLIRRDDARSDSSSRQP